MKILIYGHLFPPSMGGMQLQNLETARGLHFLGHDVEMIACDNKGARTFIKNLEFPVHLLRKWPFAPMHSSSGISLLNWLFIPIYVAQIKKMIRSHSPDIVLVADETANFYWGFLAAHSASPYVSYCSVPLLALLQSKGRSKLLHPFGELFPAIIRRQLKKSYENSKPMLVVSNSTKNSLATAIPELAHKMHIVPHSIDGLYFATGYQDEAVSKLKVRLSLSDQHFVLLSVTRLTFDKGVDDVLKALAGISPSKLSRLRYVIAGEGQALEALKDLAAQLNLNKIVTFLGGVPHLDLILYYDMCDLFVLPPRRGLYESFGRVFAEAAARSKPSIAAMEGGMLDVVDDGSTGILVPPGDITALRNKLEYLIDNPGILRRYGQAARAKAEKNYTSEAVALQFEAYLQRALKPYILTS